MIILDEASSQKLPKSVWENGRTSMFRLSTVKESDCTQLATLYNQLTGKKHDAYQLRKRIRSIELDEHYHLFGVYSKENNLVATASLSKCFDLTDEGKCYFSMENFIVDQAVRRKGIGKFLMKELELFASKNGARYISFTSSTNRKEAHAFYKAMGYRDDLTRGYKKLLA